MEVTRRDFLASLTAAPMTLAYSAAQPPSHHGQPPFHYACPPQKRSEREFPAANTRHTVITTGSGPDVIALHEINGACDEFFAFVDCLASRGFTVHAPVLFGRPYGKASVARQIGHWLSVCSGPDLACLSPAAFNRLDAWLLALCRDISLNGRRPLGAIGMCLTGIQPLAMMRSCAVVAPVLCQPTMPIGFTKSARRALALPASAIAHAVARVEAEDLEVLVIRYEQDPVAAAERVVRLKELFGARLRHVAIPGKEHSSLIHHPTATAFDAVVAFLTVRCRQELRCSVR
jgi:dienelactone hydrolase